MTEKKRARDVRLLRSHQVCTAYWRMCDSCCEGCPVHEAGLSCDDSDPWGISEDEYETVNIQLANYLEQRRDLPPGLRGVR